MAAIFDNFIDLNLAKNTWKIKVKMIRLWRQYSAGDIESIEMVLVDSNVSYLSDDYMTYELLFCVSYNYLSDDYYLGKHSI